MARRSQRSQRETFGLSGLHAPPVALSDGLPSFEEHREQSAASHDHRRALVATARSRTTACPGGLPLASSTEARPPRDALAARVRSALREISCSWSPPSEEPLSAPMVGNRAISVSFHTQHRGLNKLGASPTNACVALAAPTRCAGAELPSSLHNQTADAHCSAMQRGYALLMVLGTATALQSGLLSSVQQSRPSLAIAMRIRNPRRKGVSSRAEKANGLSIKGGYGRAAPKSGAGKQALAEAGAGKLGHVQVLLLKECALGGAGAVLPMSLAEFRNVVERKRVGRLASPREVAEAAASPEGVVAYYATKAAAAQATPAAATPATPTPAATATPADVPPDTAQAPPSD